MHDSIHKTLFYFSLFSYPPTREELYRFLDTKVTKKSFNKEVITLVSQNKIYKSENRLALKKVHFEEYANRTTYSRELLNRSHLLLSIMSKIPSVKYMGLSGSISMNNTSREGDIDLFIISTPNTLWTTRFFMLVLKKTATVVHRRIGLKICLNLFFSEKGLQIPLKKQNIYVGHELLQIKTVVDKDSMFKKLKNQNKWLKEYFPNISLQYNDDVENILSEQSVFMKYVERLLRVVQKWWLEHNNLEWKESGDQLWLIQDDYEQKILSELGE